MATATELTVGARGVDLCVETLGRSEDPPILLLMGGGASMLWWPTPICEQLAGGGRFVIRYDQRDTGRSVAHPGERGRQYTLRDLAEDALSVLDSLGIESAHLVGFSLGGIVAHLVAVERPEHVASLTLISTSPGGSGLPPPAERVRAHWEEPAPDWADREAAIDYLVRDLRAFASAAAPLDEGAARAFIAEDLARTTDVVASMTSEGPVGGVTWREQLAGLRVPTLVVHGDDDPMYPLAHGRALADEIPAAQLLVLERVGHELPARVWDTVAESILRHTAED